MNLNEFKSWFEGFSENLDALPTPAQWARIQAKIAEISDAPAAGGLGASVEQRPLLGRIDRSAGVAGKDRDDFIAHFGPEYGRVDHRAKAHRGVT